jgi:GDP-L-fucose synthase
MIRALEIPSHTDPINIGVGKGISIRDLALMITELLDYDGELVFDHTKPDGAPHKVVDGTIGADLFGWSPSRKFRDELAKTVEWFLQNGTSNVE